MKIMIIGADGQLGTDLCQVIPPEAQIPLTIKDLDITDRTAVERVIGENRPGFVINTAAYHRVDDCEDNVSSAFAVNTVGVKYLAQACRQIDAALVHLSTDYVFDGEKKSPYVETDNPNPQSVYGVSKYAGELCIKYLLNKYYIVRSTGLYGTAGCLGKGGGNFVDNIIKKAEIKPELKVVADEILSPTYTADLAKKIYKLLSTNRYGLYHIVNRGECSWYEFTVEIFRQLKRKVDITPLTSAAYQAKAKRPLYSVLKNEALDKMEMDDLRPWSEALADYLSRKGYK